MSKSGGPIDRDADDTDGPLKIVSTIPVGRPERREATFPVRERTVPIVFDACASATNPSIAPLPQDDLLPTDLNAKDGVDQALELADDSMTRLFVVRTHRSLETTLFLAIARSRDPEESPLVKVTLLGNYEQLVTRVSELIEAELKRETEMPDGRVEEHVDWRDVGREDVDIGMHGDAVTRTVADVVPTHGGPDRDATLFSR